MPRLLQSTTKAICLALQCTLDGKGKAKALRIRSWLNGQSSPRYCVQKWEKKNVKAKFVFAFFCCSKKQNVMLFYRKCQSTVELKKLFILCIRCYNQV